MKYAGPKLEHGRVSYSDDPWGSGVRDSFAISPDGELMHWDSAEGTHGQAFIAKAFSESEYDIDDHFLEDYKNLGEDANYEYLLEGWAVGFYDHKSDELWVIADLFSPDQYPVIANLINKLDPEIVFAAEEDEVEELDSGEAFNRFSASPFKEASNRQMVEDAIEETIFTSKPRFDKDCKFLVDDQGNGTFWVPPFIENGGGKLFGPVYEKYLDYPHHDHVAGYTGMSSEGIMGYITDGEVMCYSGLPITKFADKLYEWFGHLESIEWDGEIVPTSQLSIQWQVTSSIQFSSVPIQGAMNKFIIVGDQIFFWPVSGFGGREPIHSRALNELLNEGMIEDEEPERFICGGMNLSSLPAETGGVTLSPGQVGIYLREESAWLRDETQQIQEEELEELGYTDLPDYTLRNYSFDYQFSDMPPEIIPFMEEYGLEAKVGNLSSIREAVFEQANLVMGYLGCFWCKKSIEESNIEIGPYLPNVFKQSNYIPRCEECSKYDSWMPEDVFEEVN